MCPQKVSNFWAAHQEPGFFYLLFWKETNDFRPLDSESHLFFV
jgi:hypothetical protein